MVLRSTSKKMVYQQEEEEAYYKILVERMAVKVTHRKKKQVKYNRKRTTLGI